MFRMFLVSHPRISQGGRERLRLGQGTRSGVRSKSREIVGNPGQRFFLLFSNSFSIPAVGPQPVAWSVLLGPLGHLDLTEQVA